jgi:hypothetical protein
MNIDATFAVSGLVPALGVPRHAAHVLLASGH